MKPYDPKKRYLGPQGHWLTKVIPEFPPGCEVVQPYWNEAAYNHDTDYEGEDYKGFWGWVKKWLNREQVEEARKLSDDKFYFALVRGIKAVKSELKQEQRLIAEKYANIVYQSVRKGGWAFYKVSMEES